MSEHWEPKQNPHGYVEYEKNIREKNFKNETRREVLKKLLSLTAGSAIKGVGAGIVVDRVIEEVEREQGESALFNAEVEEFKQLLLREATADELLERFAHEPELIEKIKSGEVRSTLELARFFASKPVRGAEQYDRETYVTEEIRFDDEMPHAVQTELRTWIAGLCAQESNFNDASVSEVGARGIFQFMPSTVADLQDYDEYIIFKPLIKKDGEGNEITVTDEDGNTVMVPTGLRPIPLVVQTEMAGKHFSNIYKRLWHYSGAELNHIKETFFPSGGFEQYFLVPLMINSFNAGSKRLSDAVLELAAKIPDDATAAEVFGRHPHYLGYDLFFVLTKLANISDEGTLGGYKKESREYVPRVKAWFDLLQ